MFLFCTFKDTFKESNYKQLSTFKEVSRDKFSDDNPYVSFRVGARPVGGRGGGGRGGYRPAGAGGTSAR